MKVLITGATGFVGSHLTKKCVNMGAEVYATGFGNEVDLKGIVDYEVVDFTQEADIQKLQNLNVDLVLHQAAINDAQSQDLPKMFAANVWGPIHLFEKMLANGCRRFVFASSTAVYGNAPAPYQVGRTKLLPLTYYAVSKAVFEQWAMNEFSCHAVIGLRYCNVYGPGEGHKSHRMSMIGQIIRTMLAGERPKLFEYGEQLRDWAYVQDVLQVNLRAAESVQGRGIYNVGTGKPATFNKIVDVINKELGTNIEPEYIPNPFEESYQNHTECDISQTQEDLYYDPKFDIEAGIAAYLKSF